MRLAEIRDIFRIDMVETTRGCPEACLHCGAYDGFGRSDLAVKSLDRVQLQKLLLWQGEESEVRIIDLFAPYVTTFVNTEPLRATNFADFARLTHELSEGRSRVVAISHGAWADRPEMVARLTEIVSLMHQGVVPLFVVTVDWARLRGKLTDRRNVDSYAKTFDLLRSALPVSRVTASIQGSPDPQSPLYLGRAEELFAEVLYRLRFSPAELERLNVNTRSYTDVGRSQLLQLSSSEDCDVIPDPPFVQQMPRSHRWRGMIRFNGELVGQRNRPGKTYGDSVDAARWQPIANLNS